MDIGRVSGKVAIVTGAARGMGAAFARRLAQEGARVVLTDVLEPQGRATAVAVGRDARFMLHCVSSSADWQRVVTDTEVAFGAVSILVNNAGIYPFSPIEATEEADFRRVFEVNQLGVFLGMKAVLPSMRRAGGGSIINISSAAGLVGIANTVSYGASKFAVRGMTKTAALEWARDGIRVNSIHPGAIRTPALEPPPGTDNEAVIAQYAATIPAGRLGDPEEVANLVVLLASEESRFATGAEFVIDGGATCQ